ncbi:LOW QUALITY PROTEIN: hypothetical protein QYF61_015881 [Mycteria americana]|uniref:Uncharacterized protein n=1 Tax=Mycteria americana TaxID=33587 RepID=A0AAN7PDI7_MYCAM|nr:LOW QUALITY PROTEIN: hypothetical protein QYF61_015881 [Mycteria americana]
MEYEKHILRGRGFKGGVWKRDTLGEPNGNLPASARGDRTRLFLEVCSSKKRDTGHKVFLGGSNMIEKVSTIRTVKHWSRLPREVVQSAGLACMQGLDISTAHALIGVDVLVGRVVTQLIYSYSTRNAAAGIPQFQVE